MDHSVLAGARLLQGSSVAIGTSWAGETRVSYLSTVLVFFHTLASLCCCQELL